MDAYWQPLVSCHLITKIIRQRKKNIGKKSKNTIKRIFMLGLCTTLYVCMCVCVCVCMCKLYLPIIVYGRICDCLYVCMCVCMMYMCVCV